jgi:CBS domain-containing protein
MRINGSKIPSMPSRGFKLTVYRDRRRETVRRTLKEKRQLGLKDYPSRKHEGDIMTIAKSPVVTMAPTTPIYEAIQVMVKAGFRRMPIVNSGTKRLRGIITATDIVNYLGGGEKFQIIQRKYVGNFFKATNEPIKSVMTQKVFSILTTAKISDAIELMKRHNVGGLPVVDEENRVWAIVTERDVIFLFSGKISDVKVADAMSKKVVAAKPNTSIFEGEKTMVQHGFRRLPIVQNEKLMGIVTVMDILRFFGSSHVFKHLQSRTITKVFQTKILDIAVRDIVTVSPEVDVGQAAKLMRDREVGALPVVQKEKLVGIITERDFFKLIA